MKIPKQITLHGNVVKIEYSDTLSDDNGRVGEAHHHSGKIILQTTNIKGIVKRPRSMQEQWYCHELVHHILTHMGKKDLNNDEEFVDLFARLLHQALSTSKY